MTNKGTTMFYSFGKRRKFQNSSNIIQQNFSKCENNNIIYTANRQSAYHLSSIYRHRTEYTPYGHIIISTLKKKPVILHVHITTFFPFPLCENNNCHCARNGSLFR